VKIDFEGQARVLDLQHVKLKHAVAIQEFTGLPLMDWTRGLFSRDLDALSGTLTVAQAAEKMTAFSDIGWIVNMAAACWLMLAQNGDAPPLDDDFNPDVLGFAAALMTAAGEEANRVPDRPGPKASPGRRAPSSRRTPTPKTGTLPPDGPLPFTGS
jgi:hypothetical protein